MCAIDLFSKYARVVPLKDKRGISIINAFQKIISKERKPNKICFDQGSDFYNNYFKNFLKTNNIEMYSIYNEGKSFVAERFIRTLKNRIFKHMTAVSKNFYFDVLDDIVNKYNNTVSKSIKMKPINVTSDFYAKYNEVFNKRKLKLVIMLEFQNTKTFLLEDTLQICQKKCLLLVKLKIQFRGHT